MTITPRWSNLMHTWPGFDNVDWMSKPESKRVKKRGRSGRWRRVGNKFRLRSWRRGGREDGTKLRKSKGWREVSLTCLLSMNDLANVFRQNGKISMTSAMLSMSVLMMERKKINAPISARNRVLERWTEKFVTKSTGLEGKSGEEQNKIHEKVQRRFLVVDHRRKGREGENREERRESKWKINYSTSIWQL